MKRKQKRTGVRPTLLRDERGLSTVEYVILLVLIAVAGIALWQTFGNVLNEKIGSATTDVEGMGS